MPVDYDVDSPLDVAGEDRRASLPPDTAVLYVSMTRDGADVPHRPVDVLQTLRAGFAGADLRTVDHVPGAGNPRRCC